ncbi:MAG: zinc-dependent alcohol dehydrogenase family protein [Rhodoferax sp.]|nr:zinc-dependent alcohol dehydrogenase family protein [Actinomycetota bacterium]
MRAVVIEQFARVSSVQQVPDPAPAADGVVVRVAATGLCRSDWHAWRGHDTDVVLPHVPGHELVGTVAAAGAGVRRWQVGDRVTVPFVMACGRCEVCRAGDGQVCPHQTQPGFTGWGSFADLVALDHADTNLIAVPDALSDVAAASLGCRFATSYRALTARGRLRPGEWLSVHGCGGVGLSAVMIAVALGARVMAVDVSPAALDLARSLGAEVCLDARDTDVPAAVVDATDGGAHVSVDALGSPQTCVDSVLSLRRRGRQVQVGLLPSATGHPQVPMERVIGYELDLLGSHGMAAADYPPMLDLVATGALRPDLLVRRTITLDDAPQALADMDASTPTAGMTVIVL